PALDQPAVVDRIPRETAVLDGEMVEELVQRIGVALGEGTKHDPASVAERRLLRIVMRHARNLPAVKSGGAYRTRVSRGQTADSSPASCCLLSVRLLSEVTFKCLVRLSISPEWRWVPVAACGNGGA